MNKDSTINSLIFALAVIGFSLLFTFPVMWLMNNTFSRSFLFDVFGKEQMSFLNTFGFLIICRLIFGFGKGKD